MHMRDHVRAEMIAHARVEAPRECCGLLIGDGSMIDECVRARNLDPNPTRRYLLDPAAHIAVNRRLRGTTRGVIGCYHSHPHSPSVPSETDRTEALYPEFLWIIVSLAASEGGEVTAYRLTNEVFTPVVVLAAP
jgi:desampylase